MRFYGGVRSGEEIKYGVLRREVDRYGVLGRRSQATFSIDMVF
jgi:hypothetical protein